jgi:FAD binding domain of DNA photolyase
MLKCVVYVVLCCTLCCVVYIGLVFYIVAHCVMLPCYCFPAPNTQTHTRVRALTAAWTQAHMCAKARELGAHRALWEGTRDGTLRPGWEGRCCLVCMKDRSCGGQACFLTRGDLYVSWLKGVETFDRLLIDADWALNNGNWMWLSASSFFYQYFRVYSPVTFGQKYDPHGKYVRHFVPVLKVCTCSPPPLAGPRYCYLCSPPPCTAPLL